MKSSDPMRIVRCVCGGQVSSRNEQKTDLVLPVPSQFTMMRSPRRHGLSTGAGTCRPANFSSIARDQRRFYAFYIAQPHCHPSTLGVDAAAAEAAVGGD